MATVGTVSGVSVLCAEPILREKRQGEWELGAGIILSHGSRDIRRVYTHKQRVVSTVISEALVHRMGLLTRMSR
jgi:hypothetical protein